jgi:hypothetical protein
LERFLGAIALERIGRADRLFKGTLPPLLSSAKEKQVIEIKPIQLHQVEEVKRVMVTVCQEIWQL